MLSQKFVQCPTDVSVDGITMPKMSLRECKTMTTVVRHRIMKNVCGPTIKPGAEGSGRKRSPFFRVSVYDVYAIRMIDPVVFGNIQFPLRVGLMCKL